MQVEKENNQQNLIKPVWVLRHFYQNGVPVTEVKDRLTNETFIAETSKLKHYSYEDGHEICLFFQEEGV